MNKTYSTREDDNSLLDQIKKALENIKWGSIEIFIQDSMVVQITERNIKKFQEAQKNKK